VVVVTKSIKKNILFGTLVTLLSAAAVFCGAYVIKIIYTKYSAINYYRTYTEDQTTIGNCFYYPISIKYGESSEKIQRLEEIILEEKPPNYLGIYPILSGSAVIDKVVLSKSELEPKYVEDNFTIRYGAASKFQKIEIDASIKTIKGDDAYFYPLNEGLSKAGLPALIDGHKIDYTKTYNENSKLEIIASSGLGLSVGDLCYIITQEQEIDGAKEVLVRAEVVGICSPGTRLPGRLDYTYYNKSISDFDFNKECIYYPATFKLTNSIIGDGSLQEENCFNDYYILFSSFDGETELLIAKKAAEKADVYNGDSNHDITRPDNYMFEDHVIKPEYKAILIALPILCGTVIILWALVMTVFVRKIRKELKRH